MPKVGSQKLPSVLTLFTQHRRQELFFFASDGEVLISFPVTPFSQTQIATTTDLPANVQGVLVDSGWLMKLL